MDQYKSCVWGADGELRCDRVCNGKVCRDKYEYFTNVLPTHTYSINIIVTDANKSHIFYKQSYPNIDSSTAYTLDTIILPDLHNNSSPGILEIQDMTDYQGPLLKPQLLQLVIDNNGQQEDMLFNSPYGFNVLLRTATLELKRIGTTRVVMNRIAMDI